MSNSDDNEMSPLSLEGHYDGSMSSDFVDEDSDGEGFQYYAETSLHDENSNYAESHYAENHRYFQHKEAQQIYDLFENPHHIEFRTTEERLTQFPEMRLIPATRHLRGISASDTCHLTTATTRLFYPKSPLEHEESYINHELTALPDRYFQKRLTLTAKQAGFDSDCATCDTCDFIWRQNKLYQTHLRKHAVYGSGNIMSLHVGLLCPVHNCKTRCDSIATIVKHMQLTHGIDNLPFESIIFKNITEFKLWKVELERLTTARFIPSSTKHNVFCKSTFYQCHMSGRRQYQGTDKIRNRRSRKIEKTCTAFFNVRENDDGTVVLRGCTKHFGHGMDVKSLPITKDIQMEIAHLLIEGYDEIEIADHMRLLSHPMDRRYYLQNYEVRNVLSKIESYKVEFKKKMVNGEKLPSLVNICKTPSNDQQSVVFPIVKAKLAQSRYPVDQDNDVENDSSTLIGGDTIDSI
ncbi:hypothetical protein CRE_17911 [Caenorhabditis remanei]|uniref:C2H2-type domain-containing protein n=1 Tax=Caenorhabditis remanei TaxID=31234 RepID=E3MDH7_CAERE|nr:hypothetical protein CRE_17911 [Caenorhabditis remanei]